MSLGWNEYYFNLIKAVKTKSKDPHTQFGCVIVGPDHEIRTTGYNSFPRGLNDEVPERLERPEKYFWMVHAERNAIYNAARIGTALKGSIVYLDGLPCGDCAQGIIQVGVTELVYDEKQWLDFCEKRKYLFFDQKVKSWFEDVDKAIVMLTECGVKITPFTS